MKNHKILKLFLNGGYNVGTIVQSRPIGLFTYQVTATKMLPSIYSFKKSFDQRLKEYEHLCRSQESCCDVFKVWAFDLECVIDRLNWQALWQLSEENCSQYKALFPTTVVVKVGFKNTRF